MYKFSPVTVRAPEGITRRVTSSDPYGIHLTVPAITVQDKLFGASWVAAIIVPPEEIGNFTVGRNIEFDNPAFINFTVASTVGTTTSRYWLSQTSTEVLSDSPYRGQLLIHPGARFEIWLPGNANGTTFNIPEFTLKLGNVSFEQRTYTVTPCINTTTADAGFAAYMTSCPYA